MLNETRQLCPSVFHPLVSTHESGSVYRSGDSSYAQSPSYPRLVHPQGRTCTPPWCWCHRYYFHTSHTLNSQNFRAITCAVGKGLTGTINSYADAKHLRRRHHTGNTGTGLNGVDGFLNITKLLDPIREEARKEIGKGVDPPPLHDSLVRNYPKGTRRHERTYWLL